MFRRFSYDCSVVFRTFRLSYIYAYTSYTYIYTCYVDLIKLAYIIYIAYMHIQAVGKKLDWTHVHTQGEGRGSIPEAVTLYS